MSDLFVDPANMGHIGHRRHGGLSQIPRKLARVPGKITRQYGSKSLRASVARRAAALKR